MKQPRMHPLAGYLRPITIAALVVASLAVLLVQCAGGGGGGGGGTKPNAPSDQETTQAPFHELAGQGVTDYLGVYTPMLTKTTGDVTTHYFGGGDGPLCFDGSEYSISLRDTGSQNLLIYLQPGGACWSAICRCAEYVIPGIPRVGILDPNEAKNPVKGWNTALLSYCDGSHFVGDVDLDTDGDGLTDRYHRGLKNLSAGLDSVVGTFPEARKILLAGSSAGGYGAVYALPLIRSVYPEAFIYLVNDSGVGVMPPGVITTMLSEWNATRLIPGSCPDCLSEDGCLVNFYSWLLSEDPRLKFALMSYKQDTVIADDYSSMGGENLERHLLEDFSKLEKDHPGRAHSFLVDGSLHGMLGKMQTTADSVTVAEWLTQMLEDSPDWKSVSD